MSRRLAVWIMLLTGRNSSLVKSFNNPPCIHRYQLGRLRRWGATPRNGESQSNFPAMLLNLALNRSERALTSKRSWLAESFLLQPQSIDNDEGTVGELLAKLREKLSVAIDSELTPATNVSVVDEGLTLQETGTNASTTDVTELIGGVLRRATQTLSVVDEPPEVNAIDDVGATKTISEVAIQATRSLLEGAMGRAQRNLGWNESTFDTPYPSLPIQVASRQFSDSPPVDTVSFTTDDVTKGYVKNPTISMIALAHSLWSHVVRPDVDTVIDATAGNGGDSVALASLVFLSALSDPSKVNGETATAPCYAQLLSIDIQASACQNTTARLTDMLPHDVFCRHVSVIHSSHAPLPLPRNTSSVALVVYNLGFLPQADKKQTVMTSSETTIASMADAALLLRIGGMISAMTYPRTNLEEACAVRAFLEGLALFSSDTLSWETYISNLDEDSCSLELRERLSITLRYVHEEGGNGQVWRVHEHKKLGWINAPILLTATRIK